MGGWEGEEVEGEILRSLGEGEEEEGVVAGAAAQALLATVII